MPDPRKVRADANALVAELLERLANDEVSELEVKRGGVRVRVAKNGARGAPSAAGTVGTPQAVPTVPAAPGKELPTATATLTGIFYRASAPQTPAFVREGSSMRSGDVIGFIGAMTSFDEVR